MWYSTCFPFDFGPCRPLVSGYARSCGRPGRFGPVLVGERPRICRVSRPGMGPGGHRGPSSVRETVPGGVPVRPLLVDHPSQEARLPDGLRRIRSDLVAGFDEADVSRLLADSGHRPPSRQDPLDHQQCQPGIRTDRRRAVRWQLSSGVMPTRRMEPPTEIPATTETSVRLAKDLKKRGFTFVGPTTVYAFMQAMGLVNDHLADCHVREACTERTNQGARSFGVLAPGVWRLRLPPGIRLSPGLKHTTCTSSPGPR